MDVRIRRGVPSDADAVAELYLRARKSAAAAGSIPPLVHRDDEVRDWIARVVIAELDLWLAELPAGTPVGMLVLNGAWIEQLYVDPPCIGRGIGTQLLDLAKRESAARLRLWTFVSNERAQRFYERHGFIEVRRTDGSRNEEGAPDIEYALAEAPAR